MNFRFTKRALFFTAGAALFLLFAGIRMNTKSGFMPEVVHHDGHYRFHYDAEAGEAQFRSTHSPAEWEDITHGSKMGFDWRTAQAAEQQAICEAYYTGTQDRSNAYGPFWATWFERGPSKIPGRVTASEVLPDQNRTYLLTDGGYLFRGPIGGNDWTCLNNQHPLGRGVDARIEVVRMPGGNNRILAGGWDSQNLGEKFLQYSDDEGNSWQTPTGLPNAAWYRRTLATAAGTVFHMVRSDAGGTPKMVIYKSSDFGSSFSLWYSYNLLQGDHDRRCDMWKPEDSDTLFTVFEDRFIKISPDGTALTGSNITNQANPEWAILTGGRASENDPFTLYLRVWDGTENGIYRSVNGGQDWSHWGALVDGGLLWPFSNYSFTTNPSDPSKVYSGGWIVGDTEDGQTWHYPHDLGGYVGYHGDVPEMNFVKNPSTGKHELHIGTDGGFFKYQPQSDQFAPLASNTLVNTQIYKMASSHTDEHLMYIGTQDNGFNFNQTPTNPDAPAPFYYLWGGDVTQLVSGDGGKSFWCFWIGGGGNYVQNAASMSTSGIANGGPLFDVGYWEMPAAADPLAPRECLVAGYRPADTDVSLLSRLKAPSNLNDGQVIPFEIIYGTYDFKAASNGGVIGAIGVSPLDNNHLYVMTDNGVFFWSLDKGVTWQKNTAAQNKIYPRYIKVSPTNPGEVFIGGAAYGANSPCWRTTNHGQTLVATENPAVSVLKNNRVNALCFDPQGKFVFAAADIGAFVYNIAESTWQFIGGDPAPVSVFHDVDYLENSNTVRFATFSRGVWDFHIYGLISGTHDLTNQPKLPTFPNPCTQYCTVDLSGFDQQDVRITVSDMTGKTMLSKSFNGGTNARLETGNWPSGTYLIDATSGNRSISRSKVVKR